MYYHGGALAEDRSGVTYVVRAADFEFLVRSAVAEFIAALLLRWGIRRRHLIRNLVNMWDSGFGSVEE